MLMVVSKVIYVDADGETRTIVADPKLLYVSDFKQWMTVGTRNGQHQVGKTDERGETRGTATILDERVQTFTITLGDLSCAQRRTSKGARAIREVWT